MCHQHTPQIRKLLEFGMENYECDLQKDFIWMHYKRCNHFGIANFQTINNNKIKCVQPASITGNGKQNKLLLMLHTI